ncbi:unnamed protein product [Linum tenue]|uniref:Peptidase C1A papain C-terminal domain-containing protein n=1 Tax=Linum tenue TaxID=586396 RepID=A0AAV0JD87_9ROSI|nr:unnamed protein product [Linum tenue]
MAGVKDLADAALSHTFLDWTGKAVTEASGSEERNKAARSSTTCWAIAIASSIEAVNNIHRPIDEGTLWMASAQELIDHAPKGEVDRIAKRGLTRTNEAYVYVKENGLSQEKNYPFKVEGKRKRGIDCREKSELLWIVGFQEFEKVNEVELLKQLFQQPIVAVLEGTKLLKDWDGVSDLLILNFLDNLFILKLSCVCFFMCLY